jgi:hypothetical protein
VEGPSIESSPPAEGPSTEEPGPTASASDTLLRENSKLIDKRSTPKLTLITSPYVVGGVLTALSPEGEPLELKVESAIEIQNRPLEFKVKVIGPPIEELSAEPINNTLPSPEGAPYGEEIAPDPGNPGRELEIPTGTQTLNAENEYQAQDPAENNQAADKYPSDGIKIPAIPVWT